MSKLIVLTTGNSFCIIFDALIASCYLPYYRCKERKKWNEKKKKKLQIQYRTKSHHLWNSSFSCFQAIKTRNESNQKSCAFLINRLRHTVIFSWCQVFEWLSWDRRLWNMVKYRSKSPHFMMKYIQKYIMLIDGWIVWNHVFAVM